MTIIIVLIIINITIIIVINVIIIYIMNYKRCLGKNGLVPFN